MSDAGANNTGTADQDQSMEEILQSIRKIIAEENDGAEEESAADTSDSEMTDEVPHGSDAADASASDVLELTDIVEEEDNASAEATPPEDEASQADSIPDVLSGIDEALAPAAPPPAPAPEPQAVAATPADPAPTDAGQSLLSQESAAAASAAFKSISDLKGKPAAAPSVAPVAFRSGLPLEDLVIEALRPMLKEWLDSNLPPMVERIVEREIRKLTD